MTFRMFTWPENPETFQIEAIREPLYTVAGDGTVSYQGLGPMCRIITGRGVFRGKNAHDSFNALAVIMATGQLGDLVHPIWGTLKVYLTELRLEQESRENYAAYSFTFREADESGAIPKLPENDE